MDIRNYIVAESDKLFCQYGLKGVTMDDIAKHIGMSKKTIYQNFADKNELVNILISKKLEDQKCCFDSYIHVAENAIHEIVLSIVNVHASLSTLNPRIFFDLQKYFPQALLSFRQFKERNVQSFIKANLERGIAEGLYREDINVDIITQLRLEQTEIMLKNAEDYTMNKYNLAEVMTEITKHFLYGVCNKRGLEVVEQYKEKYKQEK